MVLSAEPFAAHITGKRSLVCVRTLVYQQIVRLAELTATETADVLFTWSEKNTEKLEFKICLTVEKFSLSWVSPKILG